MPYRKSPIAVGEVYHVFNRSIAKQPIFLSSRDFERAASVFTYYQYEKPTLRFSFYNRLPAKQRLDFLTNLAHAKNLLKD